MLSQGAIEELVLTLLCYSEQHCHLIALKLASIKSYSNKTNQLIATTALDYITKYNLPPKGTIDHLLENEILRGDEGRLLKQTLDTFTKQKDQLDANFVLQELDRFIITKNLTVNLQKALDALQQGDLEGAQESIFSASSSNNGNISPGLWMKDPKQALSFLERDEYAEFFSSGLDIFDHRGIRPEKKTLMLMIAAAKKGKSWFGVQVGKRGLQHHHKLLHITLEISQEKIARRYLQSIFGLTKDQAQQIRVPCFVRDENGATSIQFNQLERESVIMQSNQLREKLSDWWSCPEWIIKEYPPTALSTEHFYLYLESLEREKGFKPELVIIDYADLMKIDAQSLRIDTGRLFRELRGVAVSKNIAMVTMTQGNRESETAKLVTPANVAEDWSKIGTCDSILTYSQTSEEKKLGLARMFAAASREAEDRFIVLISQAYPIGQFSLDSVLMNSDLANQVQTL